MGSEFKVKEPLRLLNKKYIIKHLKNSVLEPSAGDLSQISTNLTSQRGSSLQRRSNNNNSKSSNLLSVFESGHKKGKDEYIHEDFILSELKQKLRMTESVLLDTSAKLGPIVIDIFQYVFANVEIQS